MKRVKKNKFISFIIGVVFILSFPPERGYSQQEESLAALKLSLEEVTEIALHNSLDIQIAKFDAYMERTSLQNAESVFDTIFTAEASYNRDKKEQASSLAGTDTKEHKFALGLEKKLPTGTTLSLDAATTKSRTNSGYTSLNPYNEAELEFSLTQELGKNFFGLADRADIKITKLDIENSDFTSLDDIEGALYSVQESYWNLVLKEEELSIARNMLKEAKKLFKIYQEKKSLGLVEKSDLLSLEALVKTRQSDVAIALLGRDTAKNDLLFLINKGDFSQEIIPEDSLVCGAKIIDLYQALTEAVKSRRDYKRKKNDLKRNDIDLVVKKNALWPQIDLEATFSRNNLDSSRGGAWDDLTGESNDEVLFKLSFKLPLERREERSELEKTRLEKSKYLLEFKRIERLILQEINNKVNQVNTMQNQVKLFETTVKLHKQKLKEQVKRLHYGRSNSDTLIQYEEDLLKAKRSLAQSLFKYRVGLIELEVTQNILLDKYWQDPL